MHALRPTSRQTTLNHLLSFREHLPNSDVQYLHFQQPLPKDLNDFNPDVMVINYDFLNYRFSPLWPYIRNRHREIAQRAGKVVAIVQDDFWAHRLLDNWCIEWRIDRILTASEDGWELLYPRSSKTIEILFSLTGYADSKTSREVLPLEARPIDLGQRVREMPAHLGRVGQAKAQQATRFAAEARAAGFVVDVSTKVEDSFLGTEWQRFLEACKFTLGMKGGASLLDPYGLIHTKVEKFTSRNPTASFEDIERACFKGKESGTHFVAVSPRLFEAASAGTCQILPPDNYLGVLEPWQHYLPLSPDMSNATRILETMRDLPRCSEIAKRARQVLIESEKFDYRHLVATAMNGIVGNSKADTGWRQLTERLATARTVQAISIDFHDVVQELMVLEAVGVSLGTRQSSAALRYVQRKLDDFGLTAWYQKELQIAKSDQCFRRSIWTWRDPIVGRSSDG